MRIGVVDVGSNTIRLLVASVEGADVVPLQKERVRLSLGEEIERRGTGGDDREAVLVGVDTAVDHRGAAARDRLGECLLEILLAVDDEASTAVGLCQGGVVREVMRELDL